MWRTGAALATARSVTLRTVIARLGRTPYPLVRLDAGYHQTADLKISIIAHELQHALETAAALRLEKQVMRELRRQPPLTAAPRHAATASDRPQPTH